MSTEYRIVSVRNETGDPDYRYFVEKNGMFGWSAERAVDVTVYSELPVSRMIWFKDFMEAEKYILDKGGRNAKVQSVMATYIIV